ncbi:MAG: 50S ribosome-binding GTPase [Planctomycetia bacterium]|nr:50S ribosome-binding GTPase [Planctomycetia bacterium]
MYPLDDTITACASARNVGGTRGIVRLSGPRAWDVLPFQKPGRHEGSLRLETYEIPVECYLWPEGKSYTGQRAAEIHTLGCLPTLDALVASFCQRGIRLAGPGEFTLRAFLSGRLDLTQAEAVLGVIDATDEKKLDVALSQLAGGLARPLHTLRDQLFELLGHLEAGFDFADEDITFITPEEIGSRLTAALRIVNETLAKMRGRSDAQTLPNVVLYGFPNIGKSQLFNALSGRGDAIVFDRPGTTRDYVSVDWRAGDIPCRLVDTAGDSQHTESEFFAQNAQERAREQYRRADLRILCFDAAAPRELPVPGENELCVWTRCDLATPPPGNLRTSAVTREGLSALELAIQEKLRGLVGGESDVVASTQSRCRESLRLAKEALVRAEKLVGFAYQELLAAEIRDALNQLGLVVGAIYTEDLLDSVFSRFCVGK